MQTTFEISGMHCQSCVGRLTDALKHVVGVRDAQVSLERRSATVETDAAPDVDALRGAVRAKGDYDLQPIKAKPVVDMSDVPTQVTHAHDEAKESLYPLFLIVGYIAGTVLLIAASTGAWGIEPMMRHFMAGFFLVFSFFKLLDIRGFVSAYRMYDLPAMKVPAWAWAYPFVELGLGVAYLLNVQPIATNVVTLVVMLVGAAGVLKALLDKRTIRCACLGTALNLPMTKVTLIEDLTMAAMAAAMLALL